MPVTALRLSYVGELGWELYTTADMGRKLWDTLWAAGRAHGLIAAGRSAFGSLRLEKGYRSWGTDMTTEHDPFEAGLGFAVRHGQGRLHRPGRARGPERGDRRPAPGPARSSTTRAEVLMGKEPVVVDGRDRRATSRAPRSGTRSGGRSPTPGCRPRVAAAGTPVEVVSFGVPLRATVADDPLFDPRMARLRS